jgi:hypothetical protein
MPETTSPSNAVPIDETAISNAVLFCQDSIVHLATARKKLNPLAISPGIYELADSMEQLQNSMLDLLNWANQVTTRLTISPSE